MNQLSKVRLVTVPRWWLQTLKPRLVTHLYAVVMAGLFVLPVMLNRRLLLIAVFPAALLLANRQRLLAALRLPLVQALMLYLTYLWVTVLWSTDFPTIKIFELAGKVVIMAAFVCLSVERQQSDPRFLPEVFTAMTAAAAVFGVAALVRFEINGHQLGARMEAFGSARDNGGAVLYAAVIVMALGTLLPQTKDRRLRGLLGLAAVIGIMVMVAMQSRGPLLALIVVGVAALLLTRRLVLVASLMVIPAAYAVAVFTHLIGSGAAAQRGMSHRPELWHRFGDIILQHPWFGNGLATTFSVPTGDGSSVDHPHNIFLATALYGGVVGLALLAGVLAFALYGAWRLWRVERVFLPLGLLLLGISAGLVDFRVIPTELYPEYVLYLLPIAMIGAATAGARGSRP